MQPLPWRGRRSLRSGQCHRTLQCLPVEADGAAIVGRDEIRPAVRVHRVPTDQGVRAGRAAPLACEAAHGARLDQFADADRRWPGSARGFVGALGDDNELLARGEQRVQQPLSAQHAWPVGPVRGEATSRPGEQVIAIDGGGPGKVRVIQAEDADYPRLDAGYVVQGSEQQRAVAVVGSPSAGLLPIGQPARQISRDQRCPTLLGGRFQFGHLGQRVAELPLVLVRHLYQQIDRRPHPPGPQRGRGGVVEALPDLSDSRHKLGKPADQFGIRTRHCGHRRDGAQIDRGQLVEGEAHHQPFDPGQPSRLGDRQAVAVALVGVDAPADFGVRDQFVQPVEFVGVETESLGNWWQLAQVHQIDAGCTSGVQREKSFEHGEHRVVRHHRRCGKLRPEPMARMESSGVTVEAEEGRDEWRVLGQGRAEHHHVTRLQGRVVGEQATQHVTQHLNLAVRPVAGMDLQRAVGCPPGRRREVLADFGLYLREQRAVGVGAASGR